MESQELLPGTLEMLILKSLTRGAMHGWGIAQHLKTVSDEVLEVGESSLYPALQPLLQNNRRARFYQLTAAGKKKLASEREKFHRMIHAIEQVLA